MADLGDLGLSEYEAAAFQTLLNIGPATAQEISDASGIPMGRIYDVLNTLEQRNIIRSQDSSRPKQYMALDPETAIDNLLEQRKQDLQTQLEQFEATADKLKNELERNDISGQRFWTTAIGFDEIIELYSDRIRNATETVSVTAAAPPIGYDVDTLVDELWDYIQESINNGVKWRIMMTPEMKEQFPNHLRQDQNDTSNIRFRQIHHEAVSFTIIDEIEVCIEIPNPINQDKAFGMISMQDPVFVNDLQEKFTQEWENAKPINL
ncbi:MAG: TrmB family transcriptional regulator [Halobacteriaceae archaeon]